MHANPKSILTEEPPHPRNVSLIALKTIDGRHVHSQYTYDSPVSASNEGADIIELTDLGEGRRAPTSGLA
ncbi:MAG TPA: hypothetical protein VJX67_03220 [Blastocatellia bacterium]|nr:hypothetical protein [Blastocatellia bacterium]